MKISILFIFLAVILQNVTGSYWEFEKIVKSFTSLTGYQEYMIENRFKIKSSLEKFATGDPNLDLNLAADLLRNALAYKHLYGEDLDYRIFFYKEVPPSEYSRFILDYILTIQIQFRFLSLEDYRISQLWKVEQRIALSVALISLLLETIEVPPLLIDIFKGFFEEIKLRIEYKYAEYFSQMILNRLIEKSLFCALVEGSGRLNKALFSGNLRKDIENIPITHQQLLPYSAYLFSQILAKMKEIGLGNDDPCSQCWLNRHKEYENCISLISALERKLIIGARNLQANLVGIVNEKKKFPNGKGGEFVFQIFLVKSNPRLSISVSLHQYVEDREGPTVKLIYISDCFQGALEFRVAVLDHLERKFSQNCGQRDPDLISEQVHKEILALIYPICKRKLK